MASCKFTNELNRLRKSSSDAIDTVEKFDDFKKYMHVIRPVEEDLKAILRKVNMSGKKTLVLLCGSAGDGKSHLLSYLKNSDEEKLVESYMVYNDATESNSPSKTAIDTLNDLLSEFKDMNLGMRGKNIILAINLGVLSNFIESEYGKEYSELRKYVEDSNILTTQINSKSYDADSNFQHISFSDYHMYSLTDSGVHAAYIEEILDKVFGAHEGNRFYTSYINHCASCPLSQRCPVKKNYEFMENRNRQRFVAELLVKATIKDKVILTTREILNFIYDILVAQNFNYTEFQKLLPDDVAYLNEFMKQITPALLFDSTDLTVIMNVLKKYDPLLIRSEKADEIAISYYVSSDVTKEIDRAFESVSYRDVVCSHEMICKINDNTDLKSQLFNLIVRISAIDEGNINDEIYDKYLLDLYMFNAGKARKLGDLYSMVETGVIQWCGSDVDGNLCLDDKHKEFVLYEKVTFDASLDHIPQYNDNNELKRFTSSIVVAFEDIKGTKNFLNIDYALYELIYKLNKGYIQTADDRNNHADFISFINKMLHTGSLAQMVSIISSTGQRASISKDKFGYKFRVVK